MAFAVDTMRNRFRDTFAAWPFRYYIVSPSGQLVFKANPDPETHCYDIRELRGAIAAAVSTATAEAEAKAAAARLCAC